MKRKKINIDKIDLEKEKLKTTDSPGLISFPHHIGSVSVKPEDKGKIMKIPFTMNREGTFTEATLTDESLSLPNEYFLGIKTKIDRKELATLVEDPDKFKLMPTSMVARMVFGVNLRYESYPPVQFPAEVGMHYFRLNRDESARIWERIKQEKAIAARWPGVESSDCDVTLYMTVPQMEAK